MSEGPRVSHPANGGVVVRQGLQSALVDTAGKIIVVAAVTGGTFGVSFFTNLPEREQTFAVGMVVGAISTLMLLATGYAVLWTMSGLKSLLDRLKAFEAASAAAGCPQCAAVAVSPPCLRCGRCEDRDPVGGTPAI
jgi:hypothetical protein